MNKRHFAFSRDYGKKPLITISKEEDYQRSPRSSMPRFTDQQRSLSSESDFDGYGSRRNSANYGPNRRASAEPRISDEDDWEEELRIRRSRYLQERVSSQERDRPAPVLEEESSGGDDEWADSLKRRSSAEGKMALLKEPLRPGNMELWTVSKMQLGSSQEPDEEELDEEMYLQQRREYREQGPPLREEFEGEELETDEQQQKGYATESVPTSFEEDDVANLDFVLKRNSKKITVQDLSKLSPDEDISADNSWNKLDVKSGLFKRESIVKVSLLYCMGESKENGTQCKILLYYQTFRAKPVRRIRNTCFRNDRSWSSRNRCIPSRRPGRCKSPDPRRRVRVASSSRSRKRSQLSCWTSRKRSQKRRKRRKRT